MPENLRCSEVSHSALTFSFGHDGQEYLFSHPLGSPQEHLDGLRRMGNWLLRTLRPLAEDLSGITVPFTQDHRSVGGDLHPEREMPMAAFLACCVHLMKQVSTQASLANLLGITDFSRERYGTERR